MMEKAAKKFEAMPTSEQENDREQINKSREQDAVRKRARLRCAEGDKQAGDDCGNGKQDDLRWPFVWRFICGLHAA
jgi:hypothetical protein